jgi:hypothetical protein
MNPSCPVGPNQQSLFSLKAFTILLVSELTASPEAVTVSSVAGAEDEVLLPFEFAVVTAVELEAGSLVDVVADDAAAIASCILFSSFCITSS